MIYNEILDKTVKYIIEGKPEIINTCFHDLDLMLANVEYGSLITIASTPAMGNTAFMTSIMYNILKNNEKCLLFTVELSEKSFIKRMLHTMSETSLLHFHQKDLTEDMIEKLNFAKNELGTLDLTIIEDIEDINTIKDVTEVFKPKYIFIDSIHSLYGFCEDVLNELKILAQKNNCFIFITCSFKDCSENREDKRPILSDLRTTGKADIISDVVLFLYRDCYYDYTKEDKNHKYSTEVIVAKNKNGSVGSFNLMFNGRFLRFYNQHEC